ncbi:MAG TPA: M3 family oligoendopeptidase [Candidatus Xenobia bacterium]|jgi:oligoendopeptidase F
MTTAAPEDLRWDLTPWFDRFDGPAYRTFVETFLQDLADLQKAAADLPPLDVAHVDPWADHLVRMEALGVRGSHIGSYLGCLSAADTTNEAVNEAYAQLSTWRSEQQKLRVRVIAGLRPASDTAFQKLAADARLVGCMYYLERLRHEAKWSMPTDLELLAADLNVDGLSAWGRLYDSIAGTLTFDMPGRKVPMAQKISLLEDRDPAIRRATLENSNAAWTTVEDNVAMALNGIAGTRLTLDRWRGVPHFLDEALFDAGITRQTLDTLLGVAAKNRDMVRRYLKLKARLLGLDKLGYQDTSCPVPLADDERLTWNDAKARVLGAFRQSYPALAEFAEMALDKHWVEAEARPGKRPGGFCSSSYLAKESRVFMTFTGTSGEAQTLAHELGHAWHTWLMRDLRAWARSYPMTLAESASTFAETLVTDALLSDPQAPPRVKAGLLNLRLDDAVAYLLNVPMRFTFEKAFYEARQQGSVRASRLKSLVLEAQREWFGDGVDPEQLDPMFWASKLHFYITGVRFYNFPYVFGYLFSLGLFARFKQQGPAFFRQYEDLLRLTGSHEVEEVARRALGVDLQKPDYWQASVDLVANDLDHFEAVVKACG